MDYFAIYDNLIKIGLSQSISGYTEKHHIIPRSLGGSDSKENIVRLTPRQHFLAHRLLAKMYKDSWEMSYAVYMMSSGNTASARGVRVTSRLVARLKEDSVTARNRRAGRTEDFTQIDLNIVVSKSVSNRVRHFPFKSYLLTVMAVVVSNAIKCKDQSGVIYSRSKSGKIPNRKSISKSSVVRAVQILCEMGYIDDSPAKVDTKMVSFFKGTDRLFSDFGVDGVVPVGVKWKTNGVVNEEKICV